MILKRWTRVIVWNEPELVYLRVPKAANSSIRRSLPGGVQKRLDIRKLARRYPRHLSFSFVRNPWARLVSIFSEKLRPEPVNDFYFVDGVHRCFVKHRLPVRADGKVFRVMNFRAGTSLFITGAKKKQCCSH